MPPHRQRPSDTTLPGVHVTVREADWHSDQAAIRAVRHAVFVVEQKIPAALEWDGQDPGCRHVLASSAAGEAVATGRLSPDGRIGRMAVMPAWRGHGVGRAVLRRLLQLAGARGLPRVYLHAQLAVAGFYRREGFRANGTPFEAAGIPHLAMSRPLNR